MRGALARRAQRARRSAARAARRDFARRIRRFVTLTPPPPPSLSPRPASSSPLIRLAATRASPSAHLHFYLVENFLSPAFKESALFLAASLGCDVTFVSYKWPNWLRQQTEKQRIVWGAKVLFLDVLFPLNVSRVIYIDADQIVRSDLLELWRHDLQGAVYGFT